MSDCTCGHPKKSHRHGGGNKHGSYTFLSSCRKTDCDCSGFEPVGSESEMFSQGRTDV